MSVRERLERMLPSKPRSLRWQGGEAWTPSAAALRWFARVGPAQRTRMLPSDVQASVRGAACGTTAADAQGFVLHVDARGARVEAPSPAGVRHGLGALVQLRHACEAMGVASVPACTMHDAPAIATRGVMLDVSRCRIPTMREFASLLDELSELRCNHVQLYVEHTFAYAGHEEAWRGWSALTPDELRTIDGWAHERGIELAMNQNCFGHMQHWLRLPAYAHLAETHGDWVFAEAWPRSGPWSLCPTDPASLGLVRDLLSQQAACVRGPLCNINCDETYDIAFGRSAGQVRERGRERVYLEFVSQVCDVVRGLGKVPMLWADIALSHPHCLHDWPAGAIALAWDYEGDDKFAAWGEKLAERGIAWWACPGTSSWCSFVGRTQERRANVRQAVAGALRHGAQGVLVTDWGDFGHWQTWAITQHALGHALRAAWSGHADDDDASADLLAGGSLAAQLDALGDIDLHLREVGLPLSRPGVQGRLRNQTALFADVRLAWEDLRTLTDVEPWERALAALRACMRSDRAHRHTPLHDELQHTVACAEFALLRAIARRTCASAMQSPQRGDLLARSEALAKEHVRLWLQRSRVGGLEQSLRAWLGPVRAELGAR